MFSTHVLIQVLSVQNDYQGICGWIPSDTLEKQISCLDSMTDGRI